MFLTFGGPMQDEATIAFPRGRPKGCRIGKQGMPMRFWDMNRIVKKVSKVVTDVRRAYRRHELTEVENKVHPNPTRPLTVLPSLLPLSGHFV